MVEVKTMVDYLSLVEQLGSGVPRILMHYPRSIYKFTPNFIRVVLPFTEGVKYDFVNNTVIYRDFGVGYEIGEAVFIPKMNAKLEDDGYLIFYRYNCNTDKSDCVILDAGNLQNQIACIKLPVRVPHGLHGSWSI